MGGCGETPTDPPLPPERETQVAIQGQDSYTFVSLFESVRLIATVTTSDGSAPTLRWSSTSTDVATVEQGLVVAVGNGVAEVVATASDAADTVTVTVDQQPDGIGFLQGPTDAVVGQPFRTPVRAAVFDALSNPVVDFTSPITVSLDANPVGATLTGDLTVAAAGGVATFANLAVDVAAVGFTLQARADVGAVSSVAFDVVVAPDLVTFENTAGNEVGLLVDGGESVGQVNDFSVTSLGASTELVLRPGPLSNEIIAFTQGRPPALLNPAAWTSGPDTMVVRFPDPIRVPMTVWIVKGPFDQQRDRAIEASITTSLVWDEEHMGVEIEEFEIIDATGDPDAPGFFAVQLCNQQSAITSQIGKTGGRINIYYVETVDDGTDRGYSCASGDVIFMAERSGHELLVHEIGHSFGLGHVDVLSDFDPTNVMHSASNTRRYLTEGQVFRSHFDSFTALTQIYGVVPNEVRFCPDRAFSVDCPALDRRVWADGRFPANVSPEKRR
jgi:hypothetical protein